MPGAWRTCSSSPRRGEGISDCDSPVNVDTAQPSAREAGNSRRRDCSCPSAWSTSPPEKYHFSGLSPRPFGGVDDPVAILVEARIISRAPIFVGAEIAVVIGVEGGPARLVGALVI